MQHVVLQEGEVAIQSTKDIDFVWFIVVKGRCDMMMKTENKGKHYPIRAFEEGDTFAYSYLKMLTGDPNAHEQGDIRAREPNTSLVRVYVEEEHRGDFRSQTKPLLYEELAMYFDMAADQAADKLGLCMSAIKKICRRHGIIRWPHRKLLSANKALSLIDSKMMEVDQTPQSQAVLRNEAIGFLVAKLRVMLNPTYLVNSELVQAQPSAGSGHQAASARVDDMFELEGSLSPNSDAESDSDNTAATGGKRKKAKTLNAAAKARADKRARGQEQGQHRLGQADSGAQNGALAHGGAWPLAAKQEARQEDKDSKMLALLANGLPVRQAQSITIPHSIPPALPLSAATSSPASDAHRGACDVGEHAGSQKGDGDMSIEHLSNMVRASLEKVPANVREQVLTSVITGMHGTSGGGGGASRPGGQIVYDETRSVIKVQQQQLHNHQQAPMLQRPMGLTHMPALAGPYPYMPSMGMMQSHPHPQFAHQQLGGSGKSIQAGQPAESPRCMLACSPSTACRIANGNHCVPAAAASAPSQDGAVLKHLTASESICHHITMLQERWQMQRATTRAATTRRLRRLLLPGAPWCSTTSSISSISSMTTCNW